jgi:nucleotide-binding universal stress UspA family protein
MYKVIMVPTDGSGFDREAIRLALRIAERTNAKIRLVRVLATGSIFDMAAKTDGTDISDEIVQTGRDAALSELYGLAAECRAISKASITVDLHGGPIGDVLLGFARRHDVDLIVISTHGRNGISRLSLGSVTDSLIRHTTIPVLVVKPSTSYLNPRVIEAFKRMIVPLDGSALAEQILPRVLELAKLEEAEITLLSVLVPQSYSQREIFDPSLPWWSKDITQAQSYLFGMATKLRREGVTVTTDVVIGENVATAIGDFASRERADLIAIATHGRGGLARLIRGSVADAVMHSSRISMLVFKPESVALMDGSRSEDGVRADLIPA